MSTKKRFAIVTQIISAYMAVNSIFFSTFVGELAVCRLYWTTNKQILHIRHDSFL